jgi:hypothetical protein
MESIANSAGAWVTYDIMEGKWAVVINKPRDPDAYFNDDNIIGSINVSGTGLSDLYNSVEVQFPHRDLNDQSDFINIEIPDEDRNPNEPDNTLTLSYDQVNEPIQAQLLGLIELKQSRIDLVIQFTTDFSQINIEAGHVIAVTNSIYGWTDKLFRVVSLTEVENESGINIEITALEYDANVYDTTDLYRYLRTNADGIITIGAIGQPGQPQVTKFESASRPRFIVESELPDSTDPLNPAGVIEAMEFWIYQIPSGELPTWELVDDTTRIYTLYKTIPTGPGSGDSTITNIKLDMDNFDPGNFLVKTRCINSTTTGPFSDLSGLVEYTPLQITDAINPDTKTLDSSGNNIVGALTAAGLLALLKGLMADGNTGSGSVYKQIFDVFNTTEGTDLRSVPAGTDFSKVMVSASAGFTTINNLNQTTGSYATMHTVSFTAPATATYRIDVLIDQNSSGARGGRGSDWSEASDVIAVGFDLKLTASPYTSVKSSTSGGVGAQFWMDFALTGQVTLTQGVGYTLYFVYKQETASNNTAKASFDIGWNVYTVGV